MSCNGCRVLRKGCSENCMLRQCLQWIGSPQAQSNATLFVAKFFGRAGLMSFISAVPEIQRPALFQSLLYEAVGRTVNPVSGAVGLLWTGNWSLCQSAMETVLSGGTLQPLPDLVVMELDDVSESAVLNCSTTPREVISAQSKALKGKVIHDEFHNFHDDLDLAATDLDLRLMTGLPNRTVKRRAATPSEESETTTSGSGLENCSTGVGERKPLSLFL